MRATMMAALAAMTVTTQTGFQDVSVGGTLAVTGAATLSSTLAVTGATTTAAHVMGTTTITGADTLDASDCGKVHFVTAGIDGASITLPSTIAGCVLKFIYTGADDAALLDISPAAADAIHGTCTLASSVVEFNGTDDNDVGFTKATINTGDTMTLNGDGSAGWYVTACAGIAANN